MLNERSKEEIINDIKNIITEYIQPAVDSHGGIINFVNYEAGNLELMLSGACSGCAGSTMTLKMGVEQMIMQNVTEVKNVIAYDDPSSMVDPFYSVDHFTSYFDD